MKAKFGVLVAIALVLAVSGPASAKDKIVHFPFANAVAEATQSGKLDGAVKFYLTGHAPQGQVAVLKDDVSVNRKTNAFGKADQKTCDWALQSALIALQDQAKAAGANAVVDIVSDYGNEYRDGEKYECHVGFVMSGVIMKGKLAKVQP
ncbi:excinuclease [Dyella choica]|uniref:Excinuclease n=1 Tax=Dyella choica TaxID=1927959 RepID=A0A432M392_9GAMM|nr:excinuclease [Dyella choica]RUL72963.1 excinuclease [Dyella choica]